MEVDLLVCQKSAILLLSNLITIKWFSDGDASNLVYGPDFLLSRDVVVVAIQYRLGIFGFVSLGSGAYTGNMAMKDQQLAFKYIWSNIENFSGDKENILIFGQSAGQ